MFTNIYSYFSRTEDTTKPVQEEVKSDLSTQYNSVPQQQYRGICKLINGKAEIEFSTEVKNPQVFLTNSSNWDLVRVENRETLTNGKFTIISNNLTSNAIVDWLVITDKTLKKIEPEPVKVEEVKVEKSAVNNVQSDLLRELLQKMNTKTLENKPLPEIPEKKKKEKSKFEKDLQERKNIIMNKKKGNALSHKRKIERAELQ
jgi:hypothetical protein